MSVPQWMILWRCGRTVIGTGLPASFLTCLAGTLFNALPDGHRHGLEPAGLMRRLAVGYPRSAAVMVLAFPLLSGTARHRSADVGA